MTDDDAVSPDDQDFVFNRAVQVQVDLIKWLKAKRTKSNNADVMKTACLVWYDKVASFNITDPWLRDYIRLVPFDLKYNPARVQALLEREFGYTPDAAARRLAGVTA